MNLTDGLDGLAIGPVMINAGTYLVWAYLAGATFGIAHVAQRFVVARYLDIPLIASAGELSIYCGAMVGAGIGFLWYNTYPAQVFMGDVGVARARRRARDVRRLHQERAPLDHPRRRLLPRGRQRHRPGRELQAHRAGAIFLMAPIHHHYEKKGWAEPKIIVRFWIISILLALVSASRA